MYKCSMYKLHRRNDFTESEKRGTHLKIILLNHQNNYVKNSSMMSNVTKNFDILATSLSTLNNSINPT